MSISKNIKQSPIGFFDSGVGGLTVLSRLKKLLPNEKYIFYGDTAHVPYGNKSKEELLAFSSNILNYFRERNCKAVVMACNTTSSLIYDDINNKFPFIIFPVVQSVAKVIASENVVNLGIFATKATITSRAYDNEISKYNSNIKVFGQYCPDWVNIVENNSKNSSESIEIIKNDLMKMLKNNPDKIVLGCTHYPFLLDILSQFAPENLFIDPAIPFAEYIYKTLKSKDLLNEMPCISDNEFFVSAEPNKFEIAAKMFYQLENSPKLLTF